MEAAVVVVSTAVGAEALTAAVAADAGNRFTNGSLKRLPSGSRFILCCGQLQTAMQDDLVAVRVGQEEVSATVARELVVGNAPSFER